MVDKLKVDGLYENESNDEYKEEEDEDYDPTKGPVTVGDNEDVEGDEENEGDEEDEYTVENDAESGTKRDYSMIESDTGGLIKTRHARQVEEEFKKRNKYTNISSDGVSEEAKSLWEELQNLGQERLRVNVSSTSVVSGNADKGQNLDNNIIDEEMIWIERSYKFANQVINEKKQVLRTSAEAKEYLDNLKFQKEDNSNSKSHDKQNKANNAVKKEHIDEHGNKLNLRRPLKRPPILEQIIAGSLKPNLTTLEKSKLDWASYVDKEGINDELLLHNKDGYLSKQDFLNRVETNDNEKYKEFRKKQLAQQFEASK